MTDERRRVSLRHERQVTARMGIRRQGGSGSGRDQKGDGKGRVGDDDVLWEGKTVLRGARQITVRGDDLIEHERDALIEGRQAVFGIRLMERDWVILSLEDYLEGRLDEKG